MRLPCPHLALPASRRGRLALGLVVLVLILALGGGGYAWHRHGIYLASPQRAVDRLNQALAAPDPVLFTEAVDAGTLAAGFVKAVASGERNTPLRALNTAETQWADIVQMTLLALLRDENLPRFVREADIPMVPADLREQLVRSPFVLDKDERAPVAVTAVTHPELGAMSLRLELEPADGGWRVVRVLNAPELVTRYRRGQDEKRRLRQEADRRKNAENQSALARIIPDPVCTGGVTRISGNVPLLALSMNSGSNPGPESVEAWGVTLVLSAVDGTVMARPRITLTSKIQPGARAVGSWSQDIDEDQYRRLAQAGPLNCTVALDYAILTDGKIYKVTPE